MPRSAGAVVKRFLSSTKTLNYTLALSDFLLPFQISIRYSESSLAPGILWSFRICKKILEIWKPQITKILKLPEKIWLSVGKFKKITPRPFSSQGKAKTAPYRAPATIRGTTGAVRIRPDLVHLWHGEVGWCKMWPFWSKFVPHAAPCLNIEILALKFFWSST